MIIVLTNVKKCNENDYDYHSQVQVEETGIHYLTIMPRYSPSSTFPGILTTRNNSTSSRKY